MTDTPDPYRELRELAEAILSLTAKTPEIQAGWVSALAGQVDTILALLAERDRLANPWEPMTRALDRAEAAEAALRKSEERAGKLAEALRYYADPANKVPDGGKRAYAALAGEATDG